MVSLAAASVSCLLPSSLSTYSSDILPAIGIICFWVLVPRHSSICVLDFHSSPCVEFRIPFGAPVWILKNRRRTGLLHHHHSSSPPSNIQYQMLADIINTAVKHTHTHIYIYAHLPNLCPPPPHIPRKAIHFAVYSKIYIGSGRVICMSRHSQCDATRSRAVPGASQQQRSTNHDVTAILSGWTHQSHLLRHLFNTYLSSSSSSNALHRFDSPLQSRKSAIFICYFSSVTDTPLDATLMAFQRLFLERLSFCFVPEVSLFGGCVSSP
jgi:hypothetical protein